jgi:hypothetical protein
MRFASAIFCVCVLVLLAGCCAIDYGATSPGATGSIRQSAPPRRPAAASKPAASETEKARAAQEKQCQQRHIDWAKGLLFETSEEKRMRDEICAAYYRGS